MNDLLLPEITNTNKFELKTNEKEKQEQEKDVLEN